MKKLLVVGAIAALGLNSVVLAGGLPEEPMASPTASTSDTGVYLGIQGGFGMTNWKNLDGVFTSSRTVGGVLVTNTTTTKVGRDNGFVGRVFLGYDINRYFALEAGYSYFFNKPTFDTTATIAAQGVTATNTTSGKIKRTHNIDVMGKIKVPVVDNFDLYAKLGVNYLMTKPDSGNMSSTNNFNVAFGAGADYYITPNIIANVEWLRFNGKAKVTDSKYQPNTDAFLIGLRYKFEI